MITGSSLCNRSVSPPRDFCERPIGVPARRDDADDAGRPAAASSGAGAFGRFFFSGTVLRAHASHFDGAGSSSTVHADDVACPGSPGSASRKRVCATSKDKSSECEVANGLVRSRM